LTETRKGSQDCSTYLKSRKGDDWEGKSDYGRVFSFITPWVIRVSRCAAGCKIGVDKDIGS